MVVTLLAILELARLKAVRVLQSPTDDTLFITQVSERGAGGGAARDHHVGRSVENRQPRTTEADDEEKHEET